MVFRTLTNYVAALGVMAMPFALTADEQQAAPPAPEKKVPTKEELHSEAYVNKLSRTYGHMIQKSMNNPMVKLDPKLVIQGIQDGMDGKPAPLTDKEYEESLTLIQQYAYEDMAKKNLEEAEASLKKYAAEDGVVTLEGGKVLYKITQPGSGEAVTEDTIPTINYEANYSNGQKLGSSEQTGGPIEVKLSDTIPGFSKGMLGMKVGEKRRIYIHPEFGFGKSGHLPNGLLIFDIEVTKISPKPAAGEDADDEDDAEDDDDDEDLSALLSTEELLADDDDYDDEEDEDDEEDLNDLNYSRTSNQEPAATPTKK